MSRALNSGGVKSTPINLSGHVVALVHIDGQAYIADPDFGLGLFKYENDMWDKVKESYRSIYIQIVQTDIVMPTLEKAFARTADDRLYSMATLNLKEFTQSIIINGIQFLAYIILLVLLWVFSNPMRNILRRK